MHQQKRKIQLDEFEKGHAQSVAVSSERSACGDETEHLWTFILALWWTNTCQIKTLKQKAMDRQKGKAVTFLSPSGLRGYEVVEKGAKSDTNTSKLPSRGKAIMKWHEVLHKTKADLHRASCTNILHKLACSLYCRGAKSTQNAITSLLLASHKMRICPTVSRHQIFNRARSSQHSYYHHTYSTRSTMKQRDLPCQNSGNAITLLFRPELCLLKKTIKEAPIHPSRKKLGYHVFLSSGDGNELAGKKVGKSATTRKWKERRKE